MPNGNFSDRRTLKEFQWTIKLKSRRWIVQNIEAAAVSAGWAGMFTGSASETNLGVLPTLWTLTGPLYIFGGLLFGIATFRAGILPRWAGVLLAVGCVLGPVAALFPPEY